MNEDKQGHIQKTLLRGGREKWFVKLFDDNVMHIFREHNQETDHLANFGAEGQRKVTVDRDLNTEDWKAAQYVDVYLFVGSTVMDE